MSQASFQDTTKQMILRNSPFLETLLSSSLLNVTRSLDTIDLQFKLNFESKVSGSQGKSSVDSMEIDSLDAEGSGVLVDLCSALSASSDKQTFGKYHFGITIVLSYSFLPLTNRLGALLDWIATADPELADLRLLSLIFQRKETEALDSSVHLSNYLLSFVLDRVR